MSSRATEIRRGRPLAGVKYLIYQKPALGCSRLPALGSARVKGSFGEVLAAARVCDQAAQKVEIVNLEEVRVMRLEIGANAIFLAFDVAQTLVLVGVEPPFQSQIFERRVVDVDVTMTALATARGLRLVVPEHGDAPSKWRRPNERLGPSEHNV